MVRDRAARGVLAPLAVLLFTGCTSALSAPPVPSGPPASPAPPASSNPAETGAGGTAAVATPPGASATLARLIDGDSMELVIEGDVVEVRLLGINAPELRTVAGDDSCNGGEAKAAMEGLAGAGNLRFEGGQRDRFGRVLGVLRAGGRNLNEALVADGWALGLWSADDPALVGLMEAAADAGLGLWGDTCGPPAAGPAVGEVQADAPGPDEDHLDQEWVEITNPTDRPVALTGWSVADETTSNRFALPALELAPGATLRVVTGPGPDGAGVFHLGQDDPVWNNRGETVLVVDPAGRIAAHRFVD